MTCTFALESRTMTLQDGSMRTFRIRVARHHCENRLLCRLTAGYEARGAFTQPWLRRQDQEDLEWMVASPWRRRRRRDAQAGGTRPALITSDAAATDGTALRTVALALGTAAAAPSQLPEPHVHTASGSAATAAEDSDAGGSLGPPNTGNNNIAAIPLAKDSNGIIDSQGTNRWMSGREDVPEEPQLGL
ncbi:hypothetical protein B0T26DRAFT_752400 [Lasiosphaeria miniovina]|uniref:Uncharacterized protein n=1 Tax=Lasiosphaeria miniovina TaxID=1954250 RepID=A0AA40AMC9_9PEZI|nr:uncharacterized protein B0T26DRAFT_752400 [Lasiosphaeria miniovina]KAK0718483.1 hypothetical protein B0T26DRAFT_752400 [Lasiosphaeria miniovina]